MPISPTKVAGSTRRGANARSRQAGFGRVRPPSGLWFPNRKQPLRRGVHVRRQRSGLLLLARACNAAAGCWLGLVAAAVLAVLVVARVLACVVLA